MSPRETRSAPRVWVTGATGMLGACVVARLRRHDVAFTPTTRAEVELTEPESIRRQLELGFTHVVNCAAYTAVDKAESEPLLADAGNHRAVANLAAACVERGAALVHVSTDYVFDGSAQTPYREDAACAALGVYGASKLAGERALIEAVGGLDAPRIPFHLVRTSWLYGPRGRDFVGGMVRRLRKGEKVRVVADQHGRPTYAPDLAAALLGLAGLVPVEGSVALGGAASASVNAAAASGIYHFANAGETTWYDLTAALADQVGARGAVSPIRTDEYPTKARRPAYSVFDTHKLEAALRWAPRPWSAALGDCLATMQERNWEGL